MLVTIPQHVVTVFFPMLVLLVLLPLLQVHWKLGLLH